MKKNAFTLAEVLIVLGIIGIVATLTLPSLINNHQKKVYVTQLQKCYNQVSNAFENFLAEEDADNLNETSFNAADFLDKYFKTVETCDESKLNESECLADEYSYLDGTKLSLSKEIILNNTQINANRNNLTEAEILAMGVSNIKGICDCKYLPDIDNCSIRSVTSTTGSGQIPKIWCWVSGTQNPDMIYTCATINTGASVCVSKDGSSVVVDVNGKAEPNVKGRDLFAFSVSNKGSISDITSSESDCEDNTSWGGCLLRIQKDGWKINY